MLKSGEYSRNDVHLADALSRAQILFTITHLVLSRSGPRLFHVPCVTQQRFTFSQLSGISVSNRRRNGMQVQATARPLVYLATATLRFLIAPMYPPFRGGKAARNFSIFLLYQFSPRGSLRDPGKVRVARFVCATGNFISSERLRKTITFFLS